MIDLHSLINPTFTDIADSLLANEFPYTHLWLTGGRGCIDGDTLLDTPNGKIKVKDFQGGDIYSYDDNTGEVIVANASKPIKKAPEMLYEYTTENHTIIATQAHRFFSMGKWKTGREINVGDLILCLGKNNDFLYSKYEPVENIKILRKKPFYDLVVDKTGCYFANGVLNHNSGKSSFAAFMVVTLIMRDGEWNKKGWIPDEMLTNAVVLRKFGNTLRESVFEQIASAINMLGVENLWERTYNPMQFIYKPTGQRILLRGLDDATKTKSIKVSKGRISLVWYEELEEFSGMTEIRKANQSFLRGGGTLHNYQVSINPLVIYSYNPPRTISSWVNEEALKKVPSRLVVKSCYTTMPPDWLGKEFIKEALELREIDLQSYKHEYLGEVVGVAGVIFRNIFGRKISDVEIRQFRNCLQGLDWGFGHPAAFTQSFYDYKQNDLYIYGEVVKQGLTNPELANEIKRLVKGDKRTQIIADCEDKKSIQEFRRMGFNIIPCRKHKASKGEIYGIKWMQKINHIYIDSERCPETYKAFCAYAYKQNKDGIYQDVLPELGEDPIDSVRYALQNFIYPPTFGIRK